MNRRAKVLVGLGLLAAAQASLGGTYTLDLTGVGNCTVADGVYVSPYQGTVQGNGLNYSGFLVCDDFNTESYLNTPWTATMTMAGSLDGSEKFNSPVTFGGHTYSAQQAYNAAGWLANGLLVNLSNSATQQNYSFAIWNLFDGQSTDPAGGAVALENAAFAAVSGGYVASNVSVFTPNPVNASQEFLMVRPAPEMDPAMATSAMTLLLGGAVVLRGRRKSRI